MKIILWHLSIGFGILLLYLAYFLFNEFQYECFVVHGVAPTVSETLFCCGVQSVPLVGLLFLGLGVYGVFNRVTPKDNDTKERVE